MTTINKLRYWAYKILPLVYDDSLSYYEILAKVTKKLNEVIDTTNGIPDAISKEVESQLNGSDDIVQDLFGSVLSAIATNEGEATYTANEKEGGELIWINGTLYEVVVPMATGTNYVVGTNIVPTDIADELARVKKVVTGTKNEFYHERAESAYDTGAYLYWKDTLYKTTKDIVVNDILYSEGDNQNLSEVNIGDEITKNYTEMHEADNNLQTQIDGNDGDIEELQHKDNDLQTQITSNNNSINKRVDNIVAQAGDDNTEIVDARTSSDKEGDYSFSSLKSRLDYLAKISLISGSNTSHFINSEESAKALLGDSPDIANLPPNTIYQLGYSYNTGDIANMPVASWTPSLISCITYNVGQSYWKLYIMKSFSNSDIPYFGYQADSTTVNWSINKDIIADAIADAEVNYLKTYASVTVKNYTEYFGETPDYLNLKGNRTYRIAPEVDVEIANEPGNLRGKHRIVTKIHNSNNYYTYIVVEVPVTVTFNQDYSYVYIGAQGADNILRWTTLYPNTLHGGSYSTHFVNSEASVISLLGEDKDIKLLPANTIYQFNSTNVTGSIKNLPFETSSVPYVIITFNFSTGTKWNAYLLIKFTTTGGGTYIGHSFDDSDPVWEKINPSITEDVEHQIDSYVSDSYKIFLKVGCIGDSYTSGWLRNADQYNANYAWPKFMSKNSGNEYVNFGHSGATAKSWMSTTEHENASTNKCQCYLIGLGINDAHQSVEVGTIDDCENEEADTYYRHMYIIIDFIHTLVPDAPIFIQTRGNVDDDYNAAIREICTTYHDTMHTHCLDLYAYNYMYEQDAITNNAYGGHYRAAGYANLANLLAKIWSKYIDENPSDFGEIDKIDYTS